MKKFENPDVEEIFANYPKRIRKQMLFLRQLIFYTASEHHIPIEETIKWGEPSYVSKRGSTVRMDWKKSSPDQYAVYFNCKTKLVDTFKELYGDAFIFEGNRAILFPKDKKIEVEKLKHCILLSLTYHRRKHLSLLGS